MSVPVVHAVCLALLVVDFTARTWRTQLYLHGLRHPRSFREVFVQSAIGELASALTPLRAGGEPARVWAMTLQGIPSRVAVVSVGLEFVSTVIVIIAVGVGLGVSSGAAWWPTVAPALGRSLSQGWIWAVAVGVFTLGAWYVVRRLRPDFIGVVGAEVAAARTHARDVPVWVHLASVPLSLLNIGARIGVLFALATTLQYPPSPEVLGVGAYALVYGQAILPAPAGVGAVELGFLGGIAGELGSREAALLFWWRFYTTMLGAGLGFALGMLRFHTNLLAVILRRG